MDVGLNLSIEMDLSLRDRDCALHPENLRVRIPGPSSYLDPDIAVERDRDALNDGHLDLIFNLPLPAYRLPARVRPHLPTRALDLALIASHGNRRSPRNPAILGADVTRSALA